MTDRLPGYRVFTVPNLLSLLRLVLLVPVCWLLLTPTPVGIGWALAPAVLLAVWASTDWADGFLARRLGQVSRVGEILDPVADRVGIAVVLLVLGLAGLLPWFLLPAVVGVDLLVVVLAGTDFRREAVPVSRLGKVRTSLLLIGIVVVVVGDSLASLAPAPAGTVIDLGRLVALIGAAFHLASGVDYVRRGRRAGSAGKEADQHHSHPHHGHPGSAADRCGPDR